LIWAKTVKQWQIYFVQKLSDVDVGQVWSNFDQKISQAGQVWSSLVNICPGLYWAWQVWAGFGQFSCPKLSKFLCEYTLSIIVKFGLAFFSFLFYISWNFMNWSIRLGFFCRNYWIINRLMIYFSFAIFKVWGALWRLTLWFYKTLRRSDLMQNEVWFQLAFSAFQQSS